MVDVSNKQNNVVIKVTASNGNTNITASSDTAQYWSKQARLSADSSKESAQEAKDWANKLGETVNGIEYSAKHYAELANSYIEGFEDVVTNNTNNIIAIVTDSKTEINTTKTSAIEEIETVKTNAINTANEANTAISTNKTNAINEINTTKNSAVSSVNTTKTSAITEINTTKTTAVNAVNTSKNEALNAIANAGINNLANKDLSNLTEVGQAKFDAKVDLDSMVEFDMQEVPCITETYVNGTSWYRVYSDGWCEQGGIQTSATVTLLKNYRDTNYTVIRNLSNTSSNSVDVKVAWLTGILAITNKTTSSFNGTVETSYGLTSYMWQACGYIA